MAITLKDNSTVNASCAPITMVYWRIVNMDTALDILSASGGNPATDITGLHASFTGGTYLDPIFDITAFNNVASQIKVIKQVKDSCGNLSKQFEMLFNADEVTGLYDSICDNVAGAINFANQIFEFTASYADAEVLTLSNIPLAGSVMVSKNNSQVLEEGTQFTIAGSTIVLTYGSDFASPSDPDRYQVNYAYSSP